MQGIFKLERPINKSGGIGRLLSGFIFALGLSAMSAGLAGAASTQQGRVVNANSFPGQDLGAKINAADKALGAAREIVVTHRRNAHARYQQSID